MGTAKPGEFGPPGHAGAADARARHQPDQHRRRAGQRRRADHHRGVGVRLVPHGGRIHPQQSAHRLLRRTRRARTALPVANRVEPGKRPRSTMAPTLVFDGTGQSGPRAAVRGAGLAGRLGDHPVRRENRCGDDRLGPGPAAGGVHGRLRRGEHAEDERRRRTSRHRHRPTTATTTRWCRACGKLGHQVDLADQSSGLSAIVRDDRGLGRRRRPAPRGAGDGRHPVTRDARVARLDRVGLAGVRRCPVAGVDRLPR